jgi:hypothetical protein
MIFNLLLGFFISLPVVLYLLVIINRCIGIKWVDSFIRKNIIDECENDTDDI